MSVTIRACGGDDYDRIVAVVDAWWGGRQMRAMLPRLFFTHFRDTSFVAQDGSTLAGFICGFLSQALPDEAYVHFIGVNPDYRRRGVARMLYARFADEARQADRHTIRAVTSPRNEVSIAAHRALGFEVVAEGSAGLNFAGLPIRLDYDGPGEDRVVLEKRL